MMIHFSVLEAVLAGYDLKRGLQAQRKGGIRGDAHELRGMDGSGRQAEGGQHHYADDLLLRQCAWGASGKKGIHVPHMGFYLALGYNLDQMTFEVLSNM